MGHALQCPTSHRERLWCERAIGSVDSVLRRLLTPRWLLGLLLTVAGSAAMVRLGMWQLGRGEANHSLQNYSYALEWVLFAAFAVFCFVKLLRDEGREPDEEAPSAAVAPPPVPPQPEDDEELAAYNAYLARLNAQ
jgi:DNA-binding transcriptional regulator of glucitol operon